jgi:hypothetical protein
MVHGYMLMSLFKPMENLTGGGNYSLCSTHILYWWHVNGIWYLVKIDLVNILWITI